MQGIFAECSLRKQAWRNPIKEGRVGCLHQNIFTRKVTDIAFTSNFFNNHYRPRVPVFEVPRPRPTRPHVPYLMPLSPSSHVPKSPHTCSHVPVPLLYTAMLTDLLSVYISADAWLTHQLIHVNPHIKQELANMSSDSLPTGISRHASQLVNCASAK